MNVAIDSRWIFEKISGIGKYTEMLIEALSHLDQKNHYFLIFHKKHLLTRTVEKLKLADKKNFTPVLVPYSIFSLRNQLFLPFKLSSLKIDIFHSTNFMLPLLCKMKTIVTIHDIILIHSPHFSPRSKKSKVYFFYKWLTKLIARNASLLFTDSHHSKKDIVKYLDVKEEKIKTIYMGIDKRFTPAKDENEKNELKTKYNLENQKIILYVGRQDPYKNLSTLINAFHLNQQTDPDSQTKLVIIGEKDKRYPKIYKLVDKLNLNKKIIFTGYISDEQLYDYFKMGDLLVLPSLYEGFGLPVIEAMACKIPTISSNVSSLPEVVADAGILTDPNDTNALADNINRLLTDENLKNSLIQKGFEHSQKFTAKKMAEQVLNYYNKLNT